MQQGAPSLISTDLDFEADGLQTGALRLPYSHDRSAYGHIPIPIMVAKNGAGPTVLLTGANHGDEYEGPIALMHLMRSIEVTRVRGRIIIIPALNYPAYLDARRTSPIDKVNLNRAFPGQRNGTPTEIIAHYLETVLLPLADYAFDFHAGGSTLDYLPTLFVDRPADAAAAEKTDRLIAAFNPPRALYMDMLGEDRTLGASAARNGAFFLTGEFGGGAVLDLDGLSVVEEGLAGFLDAVGVLPRSTPAPAPRQTRRMEMQGAAHYVFAPCNGIFEARFRLGDEVRKGQIAGYIHDPQAPWREPAAVEFRGGGLALCIRTLPLVQAGDCLGHLASDL